ncbi:cysteine--tRNA ligase [Patescibacteria group bacterium]|nr:cysteine--tRNA ligase [Patescibacteria group bacterium]
MKIYDSSRCERVDFEPIEEGKVSMYICGPTVYDHAHLGHGRSAVAFDVIRKYLEYKYGEGNVTFVSNYTDIDDKMINRAREDGISVSELAAKIIPSVEEDYASLGVAKPEIQPRATDHIAEILEMVEMLEDKGYTYVLDDGVYFDIRKFEDYGKFSKQILEDLKMGARVSVNEAKKNPYDFVLWKLRKDGEDDFWASKWGDGRPGWHIECSAMTWKHLGEKFDIHGGGLDLKFPHHECEVAQSKACFGSDSFAKYWLHNGFIQVDDEKMSKSLGNFFTLKDIFKKYDPQVVRMMFLQTHYRNPINFSDELLEQAKAGLARIHDLVRRLRKIESGEFDDFAGYRKEFEKALDNDFDTSGALAAVFDMVKVVNTKIADVDVDKVLHVFEDMDKVLGVIFPSDSGDVDVDVEALIVEREQARANKDFATSDRIRDELKTKGIELEDGPNGTIWKKI